MGKKKRIEGVVHPMEALRRKQRKQELAKQKLVRQEIKKSNKEKRTAKDVLSEIRRLEDGTRRGQKVTMKRKALYKSLEVLLEKQKWQIPSKIHTAGIAKVGSNANTGNNARKEILREEIRKMKEDFERRGIDKPVATEPPNRSALSSTEGDPDLPPGLSLPLYPQTLEKQQRGETEDTKEEQKPTVVKLPAEARKTNKKQRDPLGEYENFIPRTFRGNRPEIEPEKQNSNLQPSGTHIEESNAKYQPLANRSDEQVSPPLTSPAGDIHTQGNDNGPRGVIYTETTTMLVPKSVRKRQVGGKVAIGVKGEVSTGKIPITETLETKYQKFIDDIEGIS